MDTYIAGHTGMVGSAFLKEFPNAITATHSELDLTNQKQTNEFIGGHKPDVIIIAAAKVGGILANRDNPYPFIYDNLMIEANIINSAHRNGIQNLIYLGSSCIYPKHCTQPMKEEHLLSGKLEPTNEPYAVAKIAGIKLCQALNRQYGRNYISLMPTNLYGENDNFDLETSHVLPAMIRKFHEGNVTLWGTGSPKREFLHVGDLAKAIRVVLESNTDYGLINVGTGKDITIKELAGIVADVTGYKGKVTWDKTKPDGTPRKLLDISRITELGWKPEIELKDGIKKTYEWLKKHL